MLIFYADDDAEDCELFREALWEIHTGIECMTAGNGKLALEQLTQLVDLPDFIFLDINMPLLDGRKCLVEIKKHPRLRHIPVVMYSTTSDTEEIRQYYKLGAHDFLIKPNTFSELVDSLESIFVLSRKNSPAN